MASPESDIYAIGSLLLLRSLSSLDCQRRENGIAELSEHLLSELPPRWNPPPSLGVDASQIAFFNAVLNATMCRTRPRCNLDEIKQYLEALLEVEDETVFETPEYSEEQPESVESEDTPLKAEDAIAHFNAFSRDDEMDEEQEKEEAPEEPPKAEAPKGNPKNSK